MQVCRKCAGLVVIGTEVLGSCTDKGGLGDEESESLLAGYKIFDNFKIKSSLGYWSLVIITIFQCTNISSFDAYYELHKLYSIMNKTAKSY